MRKGRKLYKKKESQSPTKKATRVIIDNTSFMQCQQRIFRKVRASPAKPTVTNKNINIFNQQNNLHIHCDGKLSIVQRLLGGETQGEKLSCSWDEEQ